MRKSEKQTVSLSKIDIDEVLNERIPEVEIMGSKFSRHKNKKFFLVLLIMESYVVRFVRSLMQCGFL